MNRADRSAATLRSAYRIVRRMAGSGANVNDFLLGRDNGEGQALKRSNARRAKGAAHLCRSHVGQPGSREEPRLRQETAVFIGWDEPCESRGSRTVL